MGPQSLEVLTTEGHVELDTLQKNSVKINNNDVPVTLKFNGTLNAINDEKGRLQLFLGRTVPYVTSTSGSGPNAMSSYSQLSVGLQSTFVVTFGKPIVIQTDENGEISVLVKRMDDSIRTPKSCLRVAAMLRRRIVLATASLPIIPKTPRNHDNLPGLILGKPPIPATW